MRYIDLFHLQAPRVIATGILEGPGGIVLVDPGPSSCLTALHHGLATLGIGLADVQALLLTHIHLDHAGASGTLVREQPGLQVFVHARGARHMIDPARLIDSATRLYGDQMDVMWGAFEPVPAGNVVALEGGERIAPAGVPLEVAYTPGHASHHVSYFDPATGIACVGDTCGGRIGDSTYVVAPTPPPDIDPVVWDASLNTILAWEPDTLFLTHFGPSVEPATHVHELRRNLDWAIRAVHDVLRQHPDPTQDDQAAALFRQQVAVELRRHMPEAEARAYEQAVPPDHCYLGLARYWRKRGI